MTLSSFAMPSSCRPACHMAVPNTVVPQQPLADGTGGVKPCAVGPVHQRVEPAARTGLAVAAWHSPLQSENVCPCSLPSRQ